MVACRWASLYCKNTQPPPPPLPEALENFGCMPLGELVLPKVKVSLYNPQGVGQPRDKAGKQTIDFRRHERPAVTKSGWGYIHGEGEKAA